jgi:8-oxo-dGTP pyrophosphatase MutT (NUDIX family)
MNQYLQRGRAARGTPITPTTTLYIPPVHAPAAVLADRLAALRPADAAEAVHREAILALLRDSPRPFDAAHFEPGHVTGSALVVAPAARAVLLVHHMALRRWLQPGGHMDPHETDPCATAVREAEEETGVRIVDEPVLFDLDVHRIPARGTLPEHLHFDIRYLGTVEGIPDAVPDGVDAARWFTLAEAEALGLDLGVRRMLAKAAARGLL